MTPAASPTSRGAGGTADRVGRGGRRRFGPVAAVAAAVGLLLVGLVWVLATRDPATARLGESPLLGRPAPAVSGPVVAGPDEGGRYSLAADRGDWVVVNFFATWCVPCRVEHPELVEFSHRHADEPVSVVSVVFDDDPGEVRRFFEDHGGAWPVVADDVGRVALDWGVAGIPESYLVAPDGTVVFKITGGVTADGLDGLLARARGGDGAEDPA